MRHRFSLFCALAALLAASGTALAQQTVARQWNEALLDAIRMDFARPTIHARNLFHTGIALYDAWAAYDELAQPYLLGNTVRGFELNFAGLPATVKVRAAGREEAMSYAVYRLLTHRFADSPGKEASLTRFDELMAELGYDTGFTATDYSGGSAAALGNYLGQGLIDFGMQDGSNEQLSYANVGYRPLNSPLGPTLRGNTTILDPNFWQPLSFDLFIDQSGNISGDALPFLGPEWGDVAPFALSEEDLTVYLRDGQEYRVYHDPGPPPHIDTQESGAIARHRARSGLLLDSEEYQWNFELVAVWSSHLDPSDGVMWDISPGAIGNIPHLPETLDGYRDFYNLLEGGDLSLGHIVNPHTGEAYEAQLVPRGDYVRVLAEFWADGPDSETPPGHWFTILNYVSDHPLIEKRFRGRGPVLDDLEWDVKAYFALGGAVHDSAVSAWGIKGWYDYVRPISAIRWMSDRGQSTRPELARYDAAGMPLVEGFIEVVGSGDPLLGANNENAGKIKLYAWRGPDYIADPLVDEAGVGWILAENWWPFQRPTFVTPPFAGYTSGHSTFSRAAAEVMTLLTGDEYFPGGVGEFHAPRNEFLVFEEGPSVDVVLQWATYRDASDQTSLSRIWGGIHPPADDIPGRLIGRQIGVDAFHLAEQYFGGTATAVVEVRHTAAPERFALAQNFPNPFNSDTTISFSLPRQAWVDLGIYSLTGQLLATLVQGNRPAGQYTARWDGRGEEGQTLASGVYFYRLRMGQDVKAHKLLLLR
jgi:hypothetical protein